MKPDCVDSPRHAEPMLRDAPQRDAAHRLELHLLLEHLLDLPLLRTFLHLLPPDQVEVLGGEDEVPLDGLGKGRSRG